MDYINISKLQQLLQSAQKMNQNDPFLPKDKKYNFLGINDTPEQILQLAIKINKRETSYTDIQDDDPYMFNTNWVLGQLKLFIWIIMFYSYQKSIDIQNFSQDNYGDLQKIFFCKEINFIKYELQVIISSSKKATKEWRQDQQILLKKIIYNQLTISHQKLNWREVSFQLYCDSQHRYYRSLQQCRQKWTNYLDPNLKKTQWTVTEDIMLFNLVETFGCKWSQISQEMKGIRNEHMVKNRYYSYMNNIKFKNIKPFAKKMMKIQLYLSQQKKKQQRYSSNDVKLQDMSQIHQEYYETPFSKQIKMEEVSMFYVYLNNQNNSCPISCNNQQNQIKIEQPDNQNILKRQQTIRDHLILFDQLHKACQPTISQIILPSQSDSLL